MVVIFLNNDIIPITVKFKLICITFNVNEDWLRSGAGEMFNSASPYEKEFIEIIRGLMPETQQSLLQIAKQLLETQEKFRNKPGTGARPG
jgi:hypothetical protein